MSQPTPINPLRRLVWLLPTEPLQVGDVVAASSGVCTVELPGGATVQARGSASVGARVFVRGGAIQGAAPALPIVQIDV